MANINCKNKKNVFLMLTLSEPLLGLQKSH